MVPALVVMQDGGVLRTDMDTIETLMKAWPDLDCRLPVEVDQSYAGVTYGATTLMLKGLNPRMVALVAEIPEPPAF